MEFQLGPEDRERLDTVLEECVWSGNKRRCVLSKLGELEAEAAEGDDAAERIVHTMAADGMMRALNALIRKPTGVLVDKTSGKTVSVPKLANVRVKDAEGAFTGATQASFWVDLPRDEWFVWADQQIHLADSLAFKKRMIGRVSAALEQFPEASTPGEACRLAGIDPDEIELDIAA